MSTSLDRLLIALENERRYVGQELHDTVVQTMLQLGLQVGICSKLLEREKFDLLAKELGQLQNQIQRITSQTREIIADMGPPNVEADAGFEEFVKSEVDLHLQRGGPPVTLQYDWPKAFDALTQKKLMMARVVQEALRNIRKHARAENVRLVCAVEADELILLIADDGVGFDSLRSESPAGVKERAGIVGMRTRVEALGGGLRLQRDRTGSWTEVIVRLPD